MNNRLDQLFKDKLADHSIAPSANAWGRVRENLSKKNRIPFVLRLAAAILLLSAATATIVWWSSVNSTDLPSISKESPAKPEAPKNKVETVQPSGTQQATTHQLNIKHTLSPKAAKQDVPNPVAENNKEPLRDESLPEALPLNPAPVELASTAVPEKPIVLEYRLESIQRPAIVAAESKEKSGFKKVIDFALEAKHSDGPAGLRQAKDELFALNFIKDKQKNHK